MGSLSSGQHYSGCNVYLRWQGSSKVAPSISSGIVYSSGQYPEVSLSSADDIIYLRWHYLPSLNGANFLGDNFHIGWWSPPQVTSSFLGDIAQSFILNFPSQEKGREMKGWAHAFYQQTDGYTSLPPSSCLPVLDWTVEKWFLKKTFVCIGGLQKWHRPAGQDHVGRYQILCGPHSFTVVRAHFILFPTIPFYFWGTHSWKRNVVVFCCTGKMQIAEGKYFL